MLKKIVKWTIRVIVTLIVLIVAAAIIIPYVFKDEIVAYIEEEAKNNLNAVVEIGTYDLTIFSSFPDITVEVYDVKVTNLEPFEGTKLADIKSLEVTLDIWSVLFEDKMEIISVGLVEPRMHVIVLEDGTANWDIAKESEEVVEEEAPAEPEEESHFALGVQRYYINNAEVLYDDREGDLYARLKNFSHSGSGDFTLDQYTVETKTTADAITVIMEGIPYLNEVETDITFDIDIDSPNEKYTFGENEIRLNALVLGFVGWVDMEGEAIDMDLGFEAKQTEFRNILSLVPAVYTRDFESVETSGSLGLQGKAKGRMVGDDVPAFNVGLTVADGKFHYPDMPQSADDIQIDIKVDHPGGLTDKMTIDINQFHLKMAGQPVDIAMHIKTPESDPYIDGNVKTNLDLDKLKEVIPMEEGESYTGVVKANLDLKGNVSALENENYDQFHAAGVMEMINFKYEDPTTPYDVLIKNLNLNFSPQFVEMTTFDAQIGKSDIAANGRLDNLLPYVFNDDPLHGTLTMNSNLMDLNEFMAEDPEAAEGASGESGAEGEAVEGEEALEEEGVVEVPGNLDFEMNTTIKKMLYDNMQMDNVSGKVTIRDHKVNLDHLIMNTLDGKLDVSGAYATVPMTKPNVDFDLIIERFDVQQTFQTFNTVQRLAPIAESAKGHFSSTMKIRGDLDENMEMELGTVNGGGRLKTHELVLENSGTMVKVAETLKNDQFKKMRMDDANLSFKIVDGTVMVDPFDFDLAGGKGNLFGILKLDQTIDYTMKLKLPMKALGGVANQALSGFMAEANKRGAKFSAGDNVDLDVKILGTVLDPKIQPVWPGGAASLQDAVKTQVTDAINDAKEEAETKVRDKAGEEADKILADAQKQADRIKAEARTQAEVARKEGYKQADDLEKQATNRIAKIAAKKAADKLRKETDKKADDMVKEADKRADKIMADARAKADNVRNK